MDNATRIQHENRQRQLTAAPTLSEQEQQLFAPLLADARRLGARLTPALHAVADRAAGFGTAQSEFVPVLNRRRRA